MNQQQQKRTENLVISFNVDCNVWRVQLYFYERNLVIPFVPEQWSSSNSNEQRILLFCETFLVIPFVMQSAALMKRRDELRILLRVETVKQQQQERTENLVISFKVSCNVWRVQLYFYKINLVVPFVMKSAAAIKKFVPNRNAEIPLWFECESEEYSMFPRVIYELRKKLTADTNNILSQ